MNFSGKSLHYILNSFGSVRQWKPQTLEQNREVFFGTADGPQADFPARAGRQHHVQAAHLGHLFEQFARRRAQAPGLHPVLERAPHDQRQEADQGMGLGAILLVVIDRAQAQVVFGDPKRVFDLSQADVSLPQFGCGACGSAPRGGECFPACSRRP